MPCHVAMERVPGACIATAKGGGPGQQHTVGIWLDACCFTQLLWQLWQ